MIKKTVHFEKMFNVIKKEFSINSFEEIQHFADIAGYIEKLVVNFQNERFAIFLVETHNDIQIRLFDTENPEKYYIKESWAPDSALRSRSPYLLNWKCLYRNPAEKSWCDIQIPLHNISAKAEGVVLKLYEIIKKLQKDISL